MHKKGKLKDWLRQQPSRQLIGGILQPRSATMRWNKIRSQDDSVKRGILSSEKLCSLQKRVLPAACFVQAVEAMPSADRAALLKFVTSCSRAPLGGFAFMTPPFTVHKVMNFIQRPSIHNMVESDKELC
eukprot:scaffold269232_cov33-Prasinocladus_malaysianus.AAC.1